MRRDGEGVCRFNPEGAKGHRGRTGKAEGSGTGYFSGVKKMGKSDGKILWIQNFRLRNNIGAGA